jgi:hypothetical protein
MKLMNRLERKFGQYAIPNVTLGLIAFQCLTFVMALTEPEFVGKLVLTHDALFDGEWWRVLTVLLMPPSTDPSYLIFILFAIYMFYLFGSALENQWGTFRYNLFLLIGYLATILAALVPGAVVTNLYLMESVFLAFAWLFPEFTIRIFFIFPVQVKWIGLVAWLMFLFQFLQGGWATKAEIAAGILNFGIFFHADLWGRIRGYPRKYRSRMEQARAREAKPPMHVCAVCGVTEQSDRKMEFRYCPQCTGTPAYCINHINNHQHK